MRLIAPLAAGFTDAPSGTAEIYRRGTSTAASVYSDWSGTTAETTHTLNSAGRVVRYTNEAVDVTVKTAAGATLVTFTDGDAAPAVNVRNAGFTGTSATGAQAYGGSTDVNTILTALAASLGGHDCKVLVNNTEYNIKDYVATTASVYNVKVSGFGAIGDGVTDDTAAIQRAITTAKTAGGGEVYFPPGTYKITTALSMDGMRIKLRGGGGPGAAILKQYGAAENWVSVTANASFCEIENMAFTASTTGQTGYMVITAANATEIVIDSCVFNGSNAAAINDGATRTKIVTCHFNLTETSGRAVQGGISQVISGCSFVPVVSCTLFHTSDTAVSGCSFYADGAIMSAATVLVHGGTGSMSMAGNGFAMGVLALQLTQDNCDSFQESANKGLDTSTSLFKSAGGSVTGRVVSNSIVATNRQNNLASASTVTPNPAKYVMDEIVMVNTATALTIGAPPFAWDGARVRIYIYQQNAGAALTMTWNAVFKGGPATVAASSRGYYEFVYIAQSTVWSLVTDTTGYA